MLAHEKAAKEAFRSARNFEAVTRGGLVHRGDLIGWTFAVCKDGSSLPSGFGWIAGGREVSSDVLTYRSEAARNCRAYVKSKPQEQQK